MFSIQEYVKLLRQFQVPRHEGNKPAVCLTTLNEYLMLGVAQTSLRINRTSFSLLGLFVF